MGRTRRGKSRESTIFLQRSLRLPVQLVDGTWELLYGGILELPKDTIAELVLTPGTVVNEQWYNALQTPNRFDLLNVGTELRVALTVREPERKEFRDLLRPFDLHVYRPAGLLSPETKFVSVHLGQAVAKGDRPAGRSGLWAETCGLDVRHVRSGPVVLPALPGVDGPADSLNHAFTLLSEILEPWRKSHTGNVYARVFYQDTDRYWHPLSDLRDGALASAERQIITALWDRVRSQLNSPALGR